MKKVIIVALLVLSLCLVPNVNAAKKKTTTTTAKEPEKVKIYLFWASWCPHCHDFIEYFADKYQDYEDQFEIVTYQVNVGDDNTPNEVNSVLMSYVGAELGREGSGIPLIIVGEWYQSGFGTDGSNIIENALAARTDKNYKDVVASVISKNNLDSDPQPFSKAIEIATGETETETPEEPKNNDTLIVVIVFAIIVLGFGGLFLYSRKN